ESERKTDDKRPRSTVTLKVGGSEAKRGSRLSITGRADAAGTGFAAVRTELYPEPKGGGTAPERPPPGVPLTAAAGPSAGEAAAPSTVPPGTEEVQGTTPGNAACGEGESP